MNFEDMTLGLGHDTPLCEILSKSNTFLYYSSELWSWKCEKLTTDNVQHMITIVHLSLQLRCTKNLWMVKN